VTLHSSLAPLYHLLAQLYWQYGMVASAVSCFITTKIHITLADVYPPRLTWPIAGNYIIGIACTSRVHQLVRIAKTVIPRDVLRWDLDELLYDLEVMSVGVGMGVMSGIEGW
jgi:hypothetical protein